MKKVELSENAHKVLVAAYENMKDSTGGEFGFSDEVEVEGISKAQKSGYFSKLNKDELIYSLDDPDEDYTQTSPTEKGVAYLISAGYGDLVEGFDVYPEQVDAILADWGVKDEPDAYVFLEPGAKNDGRYVNQEWRIMLFEDGKARWTNSGANYAEAENKAVKAAAKRGINYVGSR